MTLHFLPISASHSALPGYSSLWEHWKEGFVFFSEQKNRSESGCDWAQGLKLKPPEESPPLSYWKYPTYSGTPSPTHQMEMTTLCKLWLWDSVSYQVPDIVQRERHEPFPGISQNFFISQPCHSAVKPGVGPNLAKAWSFSFRRCRHAESMLNRTEIK